MITDKDLEKIRDYSFEVHCSKVKIFQKQGIVLEGYGIIKMNDYGVFFIEFICLEKKNILHIDWSISFPEDSLDDSQKLYLEAISLTGTIFEAEGFTVVLQTIFLHKSSVHHILLEKIRTIESIKTPHNHFYIEFNQNVNIPRNRNNSVVSTLGSESFAWNESIINLDEDSLKVRIVDDHGSKKFISIEGSINPEIILDCLTFYLGFCSGILLQPYYSTYMISNQKIITLYSTNKLYLQKSYVPAIASNLSNKEFRDGEFHFNILRNSIRLHAKNPKHFLSIFAQWRRVWLSFNSEQDLTNLALTTAIEGLLNDIFIPIFKKTKKDAVLEEDINRIKEIIQTLEINEAYKGRLQDSISHLKNITANKALSLLVDTQVLSKEEIRAWKALRNEVAHPKIRSANLSNKYDEKENFISCLNLFNSLILQTLLYNGPRNYFDPVRDAKICLFTTKSLDE